MANESFTRDEIILALDVLYSSPSETFNAESFEVEELSALLNRLPIHTKENRRNNFRNPTGITRQIKLMQSNMRTGKRDPNVGQLFFEIAFEFCNRRAELHQIATSIRKNMPYYTEEFGSNIEDVGFAEGNLLGHLHRKIEKRDGSRFILGDHCEICKLKPALYYQSHDSILEPHMLVSPIEMDGATHYRTDSFITVCPNCHTALHHIRPWLSKDNCQDILK